MTIENLSLTCTRRQQCQFWELFPHPGAVSSRLSASFISAAYPIGSTDGEPKPKTVNNAAETEREKERGDVLVRNFHGWGSGGVHRLHRGQVSPSSLPPLLLSFLVGLIVFPSAHARAFPQGNRPSLARSTPHHAHVRPEWGRGQIIVFWQLLLFQTRRSQSQPAPNARGPIQ